ncbi:hypothetical protein [Lentzea tibetensis]|uniref:hypothetical protein n=1 Tax=Lentzea tibetensis TaxID=2591470 RepID=UPI0016466430|nr:hypothetical protein [Lentzea tibetensis]
MPTINTSRAAIIPGRPPTYATLTDAKDERGWLMIANFVTVGTLTGLLRRQRH